MKGIDRVNSVDLHRARAQRARRRACRPVRRDELNLVMSVSETHNLANLRMTREQSFKQIANIVDFAKPHGGRDQRFALVQLRLPDGRHRAGRGDVSLD